MKLTSGGVKQSACSPIKCGVSPSLREQCGDNHINESTSNKLDSSGWLCEGEEKASLAPHPTAGCRSLVEHLCKHKTSSSALSGLQQNVSSEQALNQLCLALGGTLCWSHVSLSLIAHDRVATSKFKSLGLKSSTVSHIAEWNQCTTTGATSRIYYWKVLNILHFTALLWHQNTEMSHQWGDL